MSDWWKPLSFTEGRAAQGQPIIVPGWRWGGQPVALQAGKTYRFSTSNIDGTGKVHGLCRTFVVFQDYMKTIRREKVRCTAKTVQAQHLDALKDKDAIMAEVKSSILP